MGRFSNFELELKIEEEIEFGTKKSGNEEGGIRKKNENGNEDGNENRNGSSSKNENGNGRGNGIKKKIKEKENCVNYFIPIIRRELIIRKIKNKKILKN